MNNESDGGSHNDLSIEERVEHLLSKMDLEEKARQMKFVGEFESSKDKFYKGIGFIRQRKDDSERAIKEYNKIQKWLIENTRSGIPAIFISEASHGYQGPGGTVFPIALGMGATWNSDLIRKVGEVIAKEARSTGTHSVLSPLLGVVRDPRFARTEEEFGGCPYLVSTLGSSLIRGMQGEDYEIPTDRVMTIPKHYAAEPHTKAARNLFARGPQMMSPVRRFEIALEPFRYAIENARVSNVMATYAHWDGLYGHFDRRALTDRLKMKFGLDGFIISDGDGISFWNEAVERQASSYLNVVERAINAGVDIDLGSKSLEKFVNAIVKNVENGEIPEERINDAVKRILRIKFRLGLFDNPFIENISTAKNVGHRDEHRRLALKVAQESLVLLKNEEGLLPLDKDFDKILVSGPNADEALHTLGSYTGNYEMNPTVLEAIKSKLPSETDVEHLEGTPVITSEFPYYRQVRTEDISSDKERNSIEKNIKNAAATAAESDVAIMVIGGRSLPFGESFGKGRATSSEFAGSRSGLWLTGCQEQLVNAVFETGTPTVVVLMSGRPLAITGLNERIPSIMAAWFPGEKGGKAIADALFGDYNPGGSSPITWPKSTGQIPLNFPRKTSANPDKLESKNYLKGSLYPFGHGLSYTDFEYYDLEVSPKKAGKREKIEVSLKVKNVGYIKGDKVTQVYLADEVASLEPWEKKLTGFKRISLAPEEEKRIEFRITPKDLSFVNRDLERVVEAGKFEVMIGNSSEDIVLKDSFLVESSYAL